MSTVASKPNLSIHQELDAIDATLRQFDSSFLESGPASVPEAEISTWENRLAVFRNTHANAPADILGRVTILEQNCQDLRIRQAADRANSTRVMLEGPILLCLFGIVVLLHDGNSQCVIL